MTKEPYCILSCFRPFSALANPHAEIDDIEGKDKAAHSSSKSFFTHGKAISIECWWLYVHQEM